MRQIALDTETTGLSPKAGHRITEIGCVEIFNRQQTGNTFHTYLNPERELDAGAAQITGLSWDMLKDKPKFSEVVDDFLNFIDGAELIIHNAPFDLGFINHELSIVSHPFGNLEERLSVIDTLEMARSLHPGQKNNLDALCKRYSVDNTHRELHGALLDAEILVRVYLMMTAGQISMGFNESSNTDLGMEAGFQTKFQESTYEIPILQASTEEIAEHQRFLSMLSEKSESVCVWSEEEK